jgi:anti-sigma regulatory factor (Ser/Thr protein kinase)
MSTAHGLVETFRHEALFYAGQDAFVAGTLPFIREGLERGEAVLVVESTQRIGMLHEALGPDGGLVEFADMSAVGSNPALIVPAWQEFIDRHAGRRALRGIGEPIWAERSAPELAECQRHESLLNVAFAGGPAWWLLCPYDTEGLDEAVVEEAKRSHPFVWQPSGQARSAQYRGLDASAAPFESPLAPPPKTAFKIRFDSSGLGDLRWFIGHYGTAAGLPASDARDLVAAVNEVATNSVRHGGGHGELATWNDEHSVICEVRDGGRYELPLADRRRPGGDPADPRGLWLANQLCDLMQIRSVPGGSVFRVHKYLPREV